MRRGGRSPRARSWRRAMRSAERAAGDLAAPSAPALRADETCDGDAADPGSRRRTALVLPVLAREARAKPADATPRWCWSCSHPLIGPPRAKLEDGDPQRDPTPPWSTSRRTELRRRARYGDVKRERARACFDVAGSSGQSPPARLNAASPRAEPASGGVRLSCVAQILPVAAREMFSGSAKKPYRDGIALPLVARRGSCSRRPGA